jgi:hypothetical protein
MDKKYQKISIVKFALSMTMEKEIPKAYQTILKVLR